MTSPGVKRCGGIGSDDCVAKVESLRLLKAPGSARASPGAARVDGLRAPKKPLGEALGCVMAALRRGLLCMTAFCAS